MGFVVDGCIIVGGDCDATPSPGGADATVKIWDVATWNTTAVLKHDDAQVNDVSFSPDGRTIATASDSKHFSVVMSDVVSAPPLGIINVSLGARVLHHQWSELLSICLGLPHLFVLYNTVAVGEFNCCRDIK